MKQGALVVLILEACPGLVRGSGGGGGGWGADEELRAACRLQVQRQMCSEITLGKGAGSGAHFSGSKSSVQLPDPRPMSCSVQFQERAGDTSVHVTNDIFTASREVNSRNRVKALFS